MTMFDIIIPCKALHWSHHDNDDHEIYDEVEEDNNHEMVNCKAGVMPAFTRTGQGHGGS